MQVRWFFHGLLRAIRAGRARMRRAKGGEEVYRRYISAVAPLTDYILQGDFVSGSRLLLDMKPYLDKCRFQPLGDPAVWNSAVTNGIFVRFGNVELSHDELLSMAEHEHGTDAPART